MAFVLGGFAVSDVFQGDMGYTTCRMDLIFLSRFLAGYGVRRSPAGDFKWPHPYMKHVEITEPCRTADAFNFEVLS